MSVIMLGDYPLTTSKDFASFWACERNKSESRPKSTRSGHFNQRSPTMRLYWPTFSVTRYRRQTEV